MNAVVGKKAAHLRGRLLLAALLLLFSVSSFGQTNCKDNCSAAGCQPDNRPLGTKIERGCECFDNVDNDGDGKIDKADPNCASYYGLTYVGEGSDCNLPIPEGNPFQGITFAGTSSQNTADTQSKVSVGDIDGDGIPDAVITSKWNQSITVVATREPQPDGVKLGAAKSSFMLTGQGEKIFQNLGECSPDRLMFEHENLIADIDKDGVAEIFAVVSNRNNAASVVPPKCFYLVGFKYVKKTLELLPGWNGKAVPLGTNRPGTFGIADMDGDGKAEIYLRDRIYAAETGALLAKGTGDWDVDVSAGPVAVDIKHLQNDGGKMELVVGNKIFGIPNLTNRNPATPGTLTMLKDMNSFSANKWFVKMSLDPIEYGEDTHSMLSVADINRDGNIDVILSGALNSVDGATTVFYWDVKNDFVSHFVVPDPAYPKGWPWGTGRVNVGDADGDGDPELSFIAGNQLFCMSIDAGGNMINLWGAPRKIEESRSGVVTVTIYDFDSDGNPEMVYRDSQELVIIDGKTGQNKLWSTECKSHTYTEGPIIADVNGDGVTDICVTCFTGPGNFKVDGPLSNQALGQIRLFYSQSEITWTPTRKVWNQPGYFVVNINDDLTLPFPQLDQNIVFEGGTCSQMITGPLMRLNLFLNQIPFLTSSGCPIMPAPDLAILPILDDQGNVLVPAVEVIPPVCGDYNIQARFNIQNIGDLPITDNIPVSFFNGNPYDPNPATRGTLLHTTTLNLVNLGIDATFQSAWIQFNGPGHDFPMYVVLNTNGAVLPLNPNGQVINECKIDNNFYVIQVTPTPYTITTSVTDNTICSPTDMFGEARVASIVKGTTATTDWSQYNFQWYNGPAIGPYTPIAGATSYNLTGLAAGTYTVIATHKTIGCSSAPVEAIVGENVLAIPFTIQKVSDQTQCQPFNGAVSLNFNGADLTGVSILWRDEDSGNTVAQNVTSITGLKGAPTTYSATVTRGTCVAVDQVTILPPDYPSGIAYKVRDVMDCLNPQSGKVTAFATRLDPGTGAYVIDPDTTSTKYKFTWYNSVNNVRQSPIPNQPVNGPSAWGLPEGSYEVVVTNLLTNCTSVDPIPFVTIEKGYTLPTAQVDRLRPQTACSGDGNAALLGIALENGSPAANPGDYHFYWYEGQNTITKLLGTNGITYDNSILDAIQGGVRGGNQAYTVEVVHKVTGCSATAFNTAEEIINYPVIQLQGINNDICPNDVGLAFNGAVNSSVTFATQPVSDFTNYTFKWYTGSVVNEANRIPNTNTTQNLANLQGGHFTLVVEETALRCPSVPMPIQILDVLAYPQLTSNVRASANCTNPPVPDGAAFVVTVNTTPVPSNGVLAPYTFQWYTGTTPAAGNEIANATVGFLDKLQGSSDPSLANYSVIVRNDKGCSTPLSFHIPDNRVLPTLSLTPTPNTICAEGNGLLYDGKVVAVVTNLVGSINDYTFTWTNASLGNRDNVVGTPGLVWDNIPAGTYNVRVKHTVTGCESPVSSSIVTNITAPPVIEALGNGSTNCAPFKPGNGSTEVTAMDGNAVEDAGGNPIPGVLAGYSFEWFQGAGTAGSPVATQYFTSSTLQGAADAYYTVRVRKLSNNCVNTATVQVPDLSALPIITLSQDPNLNCENFNGAAHVTGITHKGSPYTNLGNISYSWYDGSGTTTPHSPAVNNADLTGLEGGRFYSATVTMIAEGCTSSYVAIEVANGIVYPDITTSVTGSKNCPGGTPDGSAEVTAVTPVGTYEFRWYTGSTIGASGSEINDNINDLDIAGLQGSATAYFTVEAKNTITRCASTETVLVPDESVLPVVTALTPTNNPNCPVFPDGTPNAPAGRVDFNGFTYEGSPVASPYNGFTFIWTGPGAPAEGANIPAVTGVGAGSYSLQVKHVQRNCVSDVVTTAVVDAQVFPDISTLVTPQTSCDDVNFPNGQLSGSVAGGPAGFDLVWFNGIGTGGTTVAEISEGVTVATLRTGNYTIRVHNTTTACTSTETVLLPNNITLPELTWSNFSPMTRCDNPNGDATPSVANVVTPGTDFTLYYVFTPHDQTYPGDPAVIKTTGTQRAGTAAGNQPVIDQLSPGYVTALVRDNVNHCESDAETVQIVDATVDVTYQLDALYKAGLCSDNGGGGIDVTVGGGVGPFKFYWYAGTPANTDINFYNNPPDMSAAVLVNTDDENPNLGNPNGTPVAGVKAGVYTLVVRDEGNGCGTYEIESVPLVESPDFDVSKIDVTTCDDPGNGEINVQVSQTTTDTGPFVIEIYPGNNDSGTVLTTQSGTNFPVNLPGLSKGEYYVKLIDLTESGGMRINEDCPLAKGIVLDKLAFDPQVNLALEQANTSCDPSNLGDGIVKITATKQPQDQTTPDYEVSAVDPLSIGFSPFPINAGVEAPLGGFGTGTYQITVRDVVTKCFTNAFITVPDQPQVPQDLQVTITPDSYCAPASNGAVTVTTVAPGGLADYEFTWYDDQELATTLHGPDGDNVYNSTKPGWKSGTTSGYGHGNQTYYVRGVKITGPGAGCPTPVVMAVVNDSHAVPQPAFTTRPNTSCLPAIGEGIVNLLTSTTSSDPAVQNAPYTYVFNTTDIRNAQNGAVAVSYVDLTHNGGNPYPVVVTNEVSQCINETSVTVQAGQFAVNIMQNTLQDQLICNPDGSIVVTEIVLNRSLTSEPNIIYNINNAPLTDDFDFEWFRAPIASPGTFDDSSPLQDNTPANIVTESLVTGTNPGQLPDMGAGTYYVIATRKSSAPGAGCATPPYRVDVLDKHVNPTVELTPFTNTSCDADPAFAEGSIVIRIPNDATEVPGPFTYAYSWTSGNITMTFPNVNNGNGSSADNDNDNPTGLMDGTYDLTVTNIQTGCEVTASTIVPKNETPVFLTEALPSHQELCFNSGSIIVTKVEVMYPDQTTLPAPLPDFTYTWTRNDVEIVSSNNELLDVNSYPDISAGTYFVTATRSGSSDGGPGYGCSSAPNRVDILERINYANVTVVPSANTACTDDAMFFEGSATIKIDETGAGAGATYEYTWTAEDPANTSLVLTQMPKPTGPGNEDLQEGLRDDNYFISVFNQTTGCVVTAETSIIRTAIPVIITEAGTTPKPICLPSGSAFVTKVIVGGDEDPNFNNFDFNWSEGTLDNVVVPNQQGVSVLDNVSYPTITQNGTLVYHVSAVRRKDALNPDNSPAIGRGCASPPVMVVIQDQSQRPTATFDVTQNTSCNDLAPNGSIAATASDPSGSTNFNFTWTLDGGGIPATAVAYSNGVENGWTKALEGTYALKLYNVDTGCEIDLEMPVELNMRASFPNIIEVVPTSPIDCNNSGSALVTRIYIGNEDTEIPGTDTRFTYTWYTAYTDKDTNTPIANETEEEILNRAPGRYFVTVMDTFEDRNCPSGPNQVEIDDPEENYPVPFISQLLPQISCRPDEGTAQLTADVTPASPAGNHVYTWFTGLNAADGNEILDGNNNPVTGSLLDNVDDGMYSIRVLNETTNCMATTYYIVEDNQRLFYPQMMFSTAPRTSCIDPNGVMEAREVGFDLLNTTNPGMPDYYRFAPNFSADYFFGTKEQAGTDFDNDMPEGTGFSQTLNRVWSVGNLDAMDIYTVKITDENTGCFVIEQVQILDKRENPIVNVMVENPLINCYKNLPNGQLTATADGKTGGYDFTWYGGQAVNPANLLYTGDKLIGAGTAMSPDLYFTVQAVNQITGCLSVESILLPDSRVEAEAPTALTLQDDSRCDADDGWVTAHVNEATHTHYFYWFNGNVTTSKDEDALLAADHKRPDYFDLPANTYTVYAQDVLTGCISRPVATIVKDVTVIPELIFKTTASYCEDVPMEHGGGHGNGTIELSLDPSDIVANEIRWTKEVDLTDAGTGSYVTDLFPGWYSVDLITTKGCPAIGRTEVPTDIRNYNLVTQNRDGKNDTWVIDCISRFPQNNVKIFNRSGVLVYEADGYNNADTVFEGIGKRGLYMTGNLLPVGTYFYIIDKRDGSKPRTGYLELVR